MTPEERLRRIKRKGAARRAATLLDRRRRDELLDEVLEAHEDPEARLPYRRSAEALGISHQSLGQMLQEHRERMAAREQEREAG